MGFYIKLHPPPPHPLTNLPLAVVKNVPSTGCKDQAVLCKPRSPMRTCARPNATCTASSVRATSCTVRCSSEWSRASMSRNSERVSAETGGRVTAQRPVLGGGQGIGAGILGIRHSKLQKDGRSKPSPGPAHRQVREKRERCKRLGVRNCGVHGGMGPRLLRVVCLKIGEVVMV